MIKVLHILTDSNFGGAGRVLLQVLRCYDRARFDMAVVLPAGSALAPMVRALDCRVIETVHGRDRSWDARAVGEYRCIIRAERPDIVHTHSAFSAKLAAYFCGVKGRVYTRHCVFDPAPRQTRFPVKQLSGWINNTLSTAIVAVADAAKENLVATGVRADKITVILNGVAPLPALPVEECRAFRRELGYSEGDFLCLISARLEPYKGHEDLLHAVRLLQAMPGGERVRVLVLGDGSCRAALERQIKEEELADRVRLIGYTDRIVPYYNIADLMLNCSYGTEATSMALIEGMSLGKPAVVTDFGGNPKVILHEENGLVAPVRQPAAMAAAISRLASEPALMLRLAARARAIYAARFTAEVMTEQLQELYLKNTGN